MDCGPHPKSALMRRRAAAVLPPPPPPAEQREGRSSAVQEENSYHLAFASGICPSLGMGRVASEER